jgi:hypothetical protein
MEKLDRVLMTREWESMFPMVHIHKNPRIMSDHNPLIMFTQYNQHNKMREFRLELVKREEMLGMGTTDLEQPYKG